MHRKSYVLSAVAVSAMAAALLALQQGFLDFSDNESLAPISRVSETPMGRVVPPKGTGSGIHTNDEMAPVSGVATSRNGTPVSAPNPSGGMTPAVLTKTAEGSGAPAKVEDTAGEVTPIAVSVRSEATGQGGRTGEPDDRTLVPVLKGIIPDTVIGSELPQTLTLQGGGFTAESRVALSWGGRVEMLEEGEVIFRDAEHLEIALVTGTEPETWAVQVGGPHDSRSNVMRFNVVAAVPTETMVKDRREPAPAAVAQEPDEWISRQTPGNFTLQLLATALPDGIEEYIREHAPLPSPLARFDQIRNGQRLHVLVQGSYASRAEAEGAAKGLAKLAPWVRDFASIKQVMVMPQAVSVTPSVANTKDMAWVWSQNPQHFTIQLSGAAKEAAVEAEINGIELPGELAVVQTLRQGKPWYVLVYGSFNSRDDANAAISLLPSPLKNTTPWARTFASLQDEAKGAGVLR